VRTLCGVKSVKELSCKDISILSDSQAAIKALSKARITSKLVNEVRTALEKLGAVNKLTIRWIPGHNELADNLARKGAENPLIGPEPFCGVGHHRVRGLLKSLEEEKRLSFWEHLPGLRQSKILLREYNHKRFKTHFDWPSYGALTTSQPFAQDWHCRQ